MSQNKIPAEFSYLERGVGKNFEECFGILKNFLQTVAKIWKLQRKNYFGPA